MEKKKKKKAFRDLLSKEHYCYNILKLLMKSSAYPAISVDNPPYMDCFSPFLQENLDPPLL